MSRKQMTKRQIAAQEEKENRKKRKNFLLFLILGLFLVLLAAFLIWRIPVWVEEAQYSGLVSLSKVQNTDNDYYMDTRTYTVFRATSPCYEPVATGEKYAYCREDRNHIFYVIPGADPQIYLSDENIGTGTGLYVSTETSLPDLRKMNVTKIQFCIRSTGKPWEIDSTEDQDLIQQTVKLYTEGELVEDIPFDKYLYTRDVKFYSEDYPYFCINLTYMHCPDKNYLFDRYSRRCVEIGDLFSSIDMFEEG